MASEAVSRPAICRFARSLSFRRGVLALKVVGKATMKMPAPGSAGSAAKIAGGARMKKFASDVSLALFE